MNESLRFLAQAATKGSGDSVASALSMVADILTILLGLAAVVAAIGAATGKNFIVRSVLRHARRRTVGKALTDQGVENSTAWDSTKRLVAERMAGRRPWSVASELKWLDEVRGRNHEPVSFAGIPPTEGSTSLTRLSDAYAALSTRLNTRLLVTTNHVPVLRREADMAANVARVLAGFASHSEVNDGEPGFRAVVCRPSGLLELLEAPTDSPSRWPETVVLSHGAARLIPDTHAATARARADGVDALVLSTTPEEAEALERRLSGKRFDGILPSLTDWRFERNASNGRGRLHLAVRQCSYSAVVLTSYGPPHGVGRSWDPGTAPGEVNSACLLTLSLMLITTDGYLVALRRPDNLPPIGGSWVPSVNGNLEIGVRQGIAEDVDDDGLLDPVIAIVREAKEELGIDLRPHTVRCVGLARFAEARDWGTHTLCFIAPAETDAEGLRAAIQRADPVEGAYEVGDQFLLLPWRSPEEDAAALLAWAVEAANVSPHLMACLAAIAREYLPEAPEPYTAEPTDRQPPTGAKIEATSKTHSS